MTRRKEDLISWSSGSAAGGPLLEERDVSVADPRLSAHANHRLTEEVRAVVGRDRVRVPADRPHPSRGERPAATTEMSMLFSHRLFLGEGAAAVVVIAAIVAVSIGSWWILAGAVVVLLIALAAVVGLTLSMTNVRERPSPSTVAELEEEGVLDPEGHFSRIVAEFTEDLDVGETNQRTVPVEDDPSQAAAEQQSATTPTGGPSGAVGPGAGGGHIDGA